MTGGAEQLFVETKLIKYISMKTMDCNCMVREILTASVLGTLEQLVY